MSIHVEGHRTHRAGWLRAAVLGANDGIVSIAGLVVGVAASGASSQSAILLAGVSGTVAGAMSMAAGEYVSVRSQLDTELADLSVERRELREDPQGELEELAGIYRSRGLEPALAMEVARQLTAHDALGAHAREELGITETLRARPLQAAASSAASFIVGAALPMVTAILTPPRAPPRNSGRPSAGWRAAPPSRTPSRAMCPAAIPSSAVTRWSAPSCDAGHPCFYRYRRF